RSDLYAIGVVLYELATGRPPFAGESDFSIMAAHIHQTPVTPVEVKPDLPILLSRAIMKALEKEPDRRFQTAQEFRAMIALARGGAVDPAPVPAAAGWDPELLARIKKEFAVYIGPMARILVDRLSKRAQTVDALYALL